jgi:tryptophanyl-tRNA synthetase
MTKDFSNKIIVSGINPSSSKGLHLGNYLGAGKQHVELQKGAKKALYFIAKFSL